MTRGAAIGSTVTVGILLVAVVWAIGVIGGAERASGVVAAYDAEQLCHAHTIIEVGADLGVSRRDQTIAVMTAMGESSLRNLPYGDWETSGVRNPDGTPTTSIGLFQQQDSWGTRDERLDPPTAAALFYTAMLERVPQPERDTLEPTIVAHRTQVNRDPQHYAPYWSAAVAVVDALTADAGADAVTPAGCR